MIKKIVCFIIIGSCVFLNGLASNFNDDIVLIVGANKVFNFDTPEKVSVVDPAIVDVVSADGNSVILSGKAKGVTDFTVVDKMGTHNYIIKVLPEDVDYINKYVKIMLKDLNLKEVYTKVMEDEGKVFLMGNVENIEAKERLKTALGSLFNKITDLIEIKQDALVEINVEVLELGKGASKTLGFKMPRSFDITNTAQGLSPKALTQRKFFDLFEVGNFQEADGFKWQLDLLENEGKVKILSQPKIVCQSGKEAELLVGGEVPVFTTQAAVSTGGGQSTQVEYKEYGIKLKISPVVKPKGKIQMGLNIEISEVGTGETIGDPDAPTAKAYPISKRNISTQLYIADGATLAIGGLIKQKSEEDLERFPWLADVPILGAFFRHKTTTTGGGSGSKSDAELFVTLTPKIIISPEGTTKDELSGVNTQASTNNIEFAKESNIPLDLQDYVLGIQKQILNNVNYPTSLANTGWEGTTTLKLYILQTGELKDVYLVKSSGYKIFDDEAMKLVKSLPYSTFPPNIRLEELKIEVPIAYKVKN